MARRAPHLRRRGNLFYFRQRVPTDLIDRFFGSEVTAPLGTGDYDLARRRAKLCAMAVEDFYDRVRTDDRDLSPVEVANLAREYLRESLKTDEERRQHGYREDDPKNYADVYEGLSDEWVDRLRDGDLKEAEKTADWILGVKGIGLDKGSKPYRQLCHAIARAKVEFHRIQARRTLGDFSAEPVDPLFANRSHTRKTESAGAGEPLSVVFEKWLKERQPPPKTASEWRTYIRRFTEVSGDFPVSAITKAHVRDFKDALLLLPRSLTAPQRALTVPEVLEEIADEDIPRLSTGAVKKALGALRSVLTWAVENGYCENNPASGIKVRDPKRNEPKRLSYDADDLKLIFTSPLYTGFRSASRRNEPGDLMIRDSRFWLPLLGLFTGARLEELGQALVSDVKEEKGIAYLDINAREEGKAIKTQSSERTVPLHPELLKLGFLDYFQERRKAGDQRLFPDLEADIRGKLTGNFSKWWGRYARKIGITDRRKVFHSFRHSFKDACRAAGIEEEVHDALTGHTTASVGRRYGAAGVPLEVKAKAMERVVYPAINLSKIYQ